jgi:peptidoglycan-N-acetylglucosamine deacetylase
MKLKLLAKILFVGFGILGVLLAVVKISGAWSFSVYGDLINRVETKEPFVALTFDDGPTLGITEEVLKILADNKVKATFFVIGQELDENIIQGRKIVDAGHELGNHSYTHKRMIFRSPSFVREEIQKTDEAIRRAGYTDTIHFRPPYAKKLFVLPYILKQQNRLNIFMDLAPDSLADIEKDPEKMTEYVVSNASAGSIVLMHVLYKSRRASITALPNIISGLRKKGLEPTTLKRLLTKGKPVMAKVARAN